jgi:hypothetical protein
MESRGVRWSAFVGVALCATLLLAACGGEEQDAPPASAPPTAGVEPEGFTPTPVGCGTGWLPGEGAGPFPPPAPRPRPAPPETPPEPGGGPTGGGVEEPYPPRDWCGTGRLGGSPFAWQGPDANGRWRRITIRQTPQGTVWVIEWGEERDGRFVTWEEPSGPVPGQPSSGPGPLPVGPR